MPRDLALQVKDARALKKELEEAGKELVPILDGNLVDAVWGSARPQAPATKLRTHKLEFAGASVADKVGRMRSKLEGEWCLTLNRGGAFPVHGQAWLASFRKC